MLIVIKWEWQNALDQQLIQLVINWCGQGRWILPNIEVHVQGPLVFTHHMTPYL